MLLEVAVAVRGVGRRSSWAAVVGYFCSQLALDLALAKQATQANALAVDRIARHALDAHAGKHGSARLLGANVALLPAKRLAVSTSGAKARFMPASCAS